MMLKYIIPFFLLSTITANADNVEKLCSKDAVTIIKQLKYEGYKPFIVLNDRENNKILHEIAFDMTTDRVLAVTIVYEDSLKKKADSICIDFIGTKPFGVGDTFRNFIIKQNMDDDDKEFNDYIKQKLKDDPEKANKLIMEKHSSENP